VPVRIKQTRPSVGSSPSHSKKTITFIDNDWNERTSTIPFGHDISVFVCAIIRPFE
jgi:hypothetical protein